MDASRWKYLKSLTPPPARTVWFSNGSLPPLIKPQGTMNIGRNASKRLDRKADIRARKVARRA